MLEINDTGVSVPTLDELITDISDGYRSIYGSDIVITANSPDGQRIGLEAQARKDALDALIYAIQMHDPQYAQGKWADVIAKLTGTKRQQGEYTISPDVLIVTDRNVTLRAGYTVTGNGSKWILDDSIQLGTGDNFINFRSEFYGIYPLAVDSSLEPIEIVTGVKAIQATKNIINGKAGQSTASLMLDRERKLAVNNTHDREGVEASLLSVDGVLDAVVLENNTNETDLNGVPAHSLNAIVLGGSSADIATMILKKIAGGGCGTHGAESYTVKGYRNFDRIIKFDRPTIKDINVTVVVVRQRFGVDVDIDYIKNQMSAIDFKISEDALAGRLFSIQNDGTFYIKSILVDGGASVAVGLKEKANISKENITVSIE